MYKTKIVNWLITRKCNLNCSYCGIVDNKIPDRMTTQEIISALKMFKELNPETFHIIYGGEPLLRDDLHDIINFCNNNEIYYTIITNATGVARSRLNKLLDKVESIFSLSSSLDPVIFDNEHSHRSIKSNNALDNFKRLKDNKKIRELVAEITVDSSNYLYLEKLVKETSSYDIYNSITCIDVAKSEHYDFSSITFDSPLILSEEVHIENTKKIFQKIYNNKNYKVHSRPVLLKLINALPFNYLCSIENDLNNLTIDSDGSFRLCLRIAGFFTKSVNIRNFNQHILKETIKTDKQTMCLGCNWTCPMMSEIENNFSENIIHKQ